MADTREIIEQEEQQSFINNNVDKSQDRQKKAVTMGFYTRWFKSSVDDLKSAAFYRALLGEMLGVMFLVFVACSSPYGEMPGVTLDHVRISLGFGLSVATMVWILANTSGGHINPAVSAGMLIARKISLVRFILYVAFQCVGGIFGSLLQKTLTCDWQMALAAQSNSTASCGLGMTKLGAGVSAGQGFGIELLITFVLVFTVFATCDGARSDLKGSGPLAIGLSVSMCHLAFIKLTGASMNTARTFGPAVVLADWDDHWIYWAGPILGGVIAGLLYELLFAGNASLSKVKAWLISADYESEDDQERADVYELKAGQNPKA